MEKTYNPHQIEAKYRDIWEQGDFSFFSGVDQIRINYATFIHHEIKASIVLVTGRTESYLKYQELAFDLHQQGYNIFIIDHRGQGLSERLLKDNQKGYVKNFDDYAHDLKQFIDNEPYLYVIFNKNTLYVELRTIIL